MNPITDGDPRRVAASRVRPPAASTAEDGAAASGPAARGAAEPPVPALTRFTIGDWLVDVPARRLRRGDQEVSLEPRPMAVLATLCRHPGEVMSAEALLAACWPGETFGDNPVHKVVAGLRKALGDSATAPRYLETIRKQGYRLVAPIGVLSTLGARGHERAWRDASPFRGLEPFDEAHAAVFFGRDDAVAALRARLQAQWQRRCPLVVLLGPSGSGKTSLVQAGLLPALRQRPHGLRAADGTGALASHEAALTVCATATLDLAALGDLDPWAGLAAALLDWECDGAPLLSGYSIDGLATDLRARPEEVLRLLRVALDVLAATAIDGPPGPPLLVLDRLEALLQAPARDATEAVEGTSAPTRASTDSSTDAAPYETSERRDATPSLATDGANHGPADQPVDIAAAFVATIDQLVASGRVLVLAVCRNDFYPGLARHPALMRDKERGAHMDLAPPDADAMAQMIRLPARAAGLVFGADASGLNRLDDRLCADAMQAQDALPLLQYTLQALYQQRGAGDQLGWDAYEALGGLEGAIGRRAEAMLAELPAAQQEALTRLLPRLVSLGADAASPTSRWVAASALDNDDERRLAQAFVEARLLVSDHVAGSAGYRVAHEALLRRWPRVTAWIAQHRATLAVRDELRPWLQRWADGARAPALLLPGGGLLWQASRALKEAPALFGADELAFVERSLARGRRQRQWRWVALATAGLLATLAVLAAIGYARQAQRAADRERQSQRLASFMLGDLADQLRPIGKLDLLSRIGEQGVRLLSPASGGTEHPIDALQRAKALVVIGEVNSSRGQGRTDIALDALLAAERLLAATPITAEVDVAEYYRTLGAAAFWQGQIALDAGELASATRHFEAYREACERWRQAAPDDAAARSEWGQAVSSLGATAFQRGAWGDAQRWFEAAFKAEGEPAATGSTRNEEADEAIAWKRFWLGLVTLVQGRPAQALQHLDAARATLSDLQARHPGEHVRRWDLGVIELRRADALRALGQSAGAVAAMREGVERLRAAASADSSNAYWQNELVHADANLLLARIDAGERPAEDLPALKSALARLPGPPRDLVRRDAAARIAAVEAELAARRQDWHLAGERLAAARSEVDDLLAQRPDKWQIRELQARLMLIERQRVAAIEPTQATERCAAMARVLQPAVAAGQGGLVLEVWLAARRCESPSADEAVARQRLMADGYVPVRPALLQP